MGKHKSNQYWLVPNASSYFFDTPDLYTVLLTPDKCINTTLLLIYNSIITTTELTGEEEKKITENKTKQILYFIMQYIACNILASNKHGIFPLAKKI